MCFYQVSPTFRSLSGHIDIDRNIFETCQAGYRNLIFNAGFYALQTF